MSPSSSPSPSSSSSTEHTSEILLARWIDRVIVSVGLGIIFAAISLPLWIVFPQSFENINMNPAHRSLGPFNYIITSLVFMAYWTYFESTTGQSIGKLLHLKTANLAGKGIDAKTAALESFGKAFLLPLDVILGWIFTNNKRQRIFNRASDTIVIKIKENDLVSDNVMYLKD